MRKIFIVLLFSVILFSCDDKKSTYELDDEAILNYLAKTKIEATKHSSGLYYVIEKEGNGVHPTVYDNIEVYCKGYYLDSVVFQSDKSPIRGVLSQFISGWQIGIPLFSEGGKGKLFLPRNLGYGSEVLIFDIDLRNVWQK